MRRKRGSGPIAQQRRMAMALNPATRYRSHSAGQGTFIAYNPRGGRSRPVSPFNYPGPDIVVSTPVDPFASTNTCPPGWVWRRNSVGDWDCSPSVLAAQGPASNPYVGPWPWGMGGWGSWRGRFPQSYSLAPGALGASGVSVGPGPAGPIYFPGPYTPEQAATVGASYVGSRGGYPVMNPYVGPWPWGRGGWGSWRAPVPQRYGVQGGAGGFSSSVGPGPGGPIAFPGPYESPEQAATVAASYIGSRGGYPFGG